MTDDLVISAFEACAIFVGDEPCCENCGWLADEHAAAATTEPLAA
jgi:hypothetical protein